MRRAHNPVSSDSSKANDVLTLTDLTSKSYGRNLAVIATPYAAVGLGWCLRP